MKVARGKVHTYLGMKLDFTIAGVVIVSMINYIQDVIKEWEDSTSKLNNGFERVIRRQKMQQQLLMTYSRSMKTK
jgi:hypothetical protein